MNYSSNKVQLQRDSSVAWVQIIEVDWQQCWRLAQKNGGSGGCSVPLPLPPSTYFFFSTFISSSTSSPSTLLLSPPSPPSFLPPTLQNRWCELLCESAGRLCYDLTTDPLTSLLKGFWGHGFRTRWLNCERWVASSFKGPASSPFSLTRPYPPFFPACRFLHHPHHHPLCLSFLSCSLYPCRSLAAPSSRVSSAREAVAVSALISIASQSEENMRANGGQGGGRSRSWGPRTNADFLTRGLQRTALTHFQGNGW